MAVVVVFTVKKRAQFVRMRKIEKQTDKEIKIFVRMNLTERWRFYMKETDTQTEKFTVNQRESYCGSKR